jgi:hypothetical protein
MSPVSENCFQLKKGKKERWIMSRNTVISLIFNHLEHQILFTEVFSHPSYYIHLP